MEIIESVRGEGGGDRAMGFQGECRIKRNDPCRRVFAVIIRQEGSQGRAHASGPRTTRTDILLFLICSDVAIYRFQGKQKEGSNIEGEREEKEESVCDYPSSVSGCSTGSTPAYTDGFSRSSRRCNRSISMLEYHVVESGLVH